MRISDWSSDGCSSDLLDSTQALVHWSRAMTMTETTSQDSALGWGWRMGVLFILSYVVRVRLSSRARRWSTQSEPLPVLARPFDVGHAARSEEHTSELQSLMRSSYDVF